MKLLIYTTLFFISIGTISFSQNQSSSVWATIEDLSILPIGEELISSDAEFQQLILDHNITSITQALPASKQEKLQKVYEIKCECNHDALIDDINFNQSNISKAEQGPEYTPLYLPNDFNLIFSNDYALTLIDAQGAWDISVGDPSIEIAISDTDFDLSHEELQGTVTIVDGPFNYPDYYHGTAVAITAAGNTDNGDGKSSIGASCALQLYSMDINELLLATYNDARVINVSWASGCFFSSYTQDVVNEVYDNGSIIVAAAGNGVTCGGPSNLVFPSAYEHVISVTSVGPQNNHQKIPGDAYSTHQHNATVDIAAPGYDVALTVESGWYLTGNGTSFASPYVAGTIGLMLSVNPCLEFEDVEDILYQTAFDLSVDNPLYIGQLGAGRLDAAAAVQMASTYGFHDVDITSTFSCNANSWLLTPDFEFAQTITGTEWMDGSTTSVYTAQTSGWKTVKLFDVDGCFGVDSIYVDVPSQAFNVIGYHVDASCSGFSDGKAEVLISGGVMPYSTQWSNGESTTENENLSPGMYTVTISDNLGCAFTQEYEIAEPLPITTSYEITCADTDGTSGEINLTLSGGTAPYNFEWDSGEETQNLDNASSGMHTVLITDNNGCTHYEDIIVCESYASLNENQTTFNIYPNPTNSGQTAITWNAEIDLIEIYDASGQLIQTIPVSQSTKQLAISQLSQGLYFIKYSNTNLIVGSSKLVVTG